MFTAKQKSLFGTTQITSGTSTMSVSENPYLRKGLKEAAKITNPQGSIKLKTSGSDFVDDFANASNYKSPRSFDEINSTVSIQWSQNPLLTMYMIFYIRMITRVVQLLDGTRTSESQRGQGLKHEGIFRMMWVAVNAPETFWKNIGLFISIGSWKDIIVMLSYDLQYNGWNDKKLDWDKMGKLILAGLENPNTSELVKKYLPQIKANACCKTLESQADNIIAKWICSLLFGAGESAKNYKQYRLLKSSGTAHQWQQLISQSKHNLIDFNTVHGRALSKMVSGKYLKNNGLEAKYAEWITSKPVAKYTGYVYELFKPLGMRSKMSYKSLDSYQVDTINKQFLNLVEVAKNGMKDAGNNGFIAVLDTSSSMFSEVKGTGCSSYSIGKGLTLFMSYLLEGTYNGCYLEFSNSTIMKQWKGDGPVQQLCNDDSCIIAGTNFQSVADHFGQILRSGVNEKYHPKGIVCFSDKQNCHLVW